MALGRWPGPADTRIRAAAPGEGPRTDELLKAAGSYLEAHEALDAWQFGTLVRTGLAHGRDAMFHDVEAALTARDLDRLFHGMTTVLVAEDPSGILVGAVVVLPPGKVIAPLAERGAWEQALRLLLTAAKLRGIAVAGTARGRGIGTTLLDQAVSLHTRLGAALVHRQVGVEKEPRGVLPRPRLRRPLPRRGLLPRPARRRHHRQRPSPRTPVHPLAPLSGRCRILRSPSGG